VSGDFGRGNESSMGLPDDSTIAASTLAIVSVGLNLSCKTMSSGSPLSHPRDVDSACGKSSTPFEFSFTLIWSIKTCHIICHRLDYLSSTGCTSTFTYNSKTGLDNTYNLWMQPHSFHQIKIQVLGALH
jgi:hypothetical protein